MVKLRVNKLISILLIEEDLKCLANLLFNKPLITQAYNMGLVPNK